MMLDHGARKQANIIIFIFPILYTFINEQESVR